MNSIRRRAFVHCHVGSLEIQTFFQSPYQQVHCHVGSLESTRFWGDDVGDVHCHVGSLEM